MQPNNDNPDQQDPGVYQDPYAQLPNSSQELPPVQQQPPQFPEYPQEQIPDVPPQPYQYDYNYTEAPLPAQEQIEPEEHPFIAPTLDDGAANSNSLKWWLVRRIAIVLVVLGILIGGGVGIYGAVNNSGDEAPISSETEEETQPVYEGDGSDIAETKDPTREFRCPDGYVTSPDDEEKCSKSSKKTAALIKSYSCPSGYSKYGSNEATKCQKVTGSTGTQKASPVKSYRCPSGYTRSGSSCSRVSTQAAKLSFSCPSGYSKSGSGSGTKCSKTTTSSTTVLTACLSDYVKSGSGHSTKCTKTINATSSTKYSCPSGFSLIGSGGSTRCRKVVNQGPGGGCPGGYTHANGKCIRDVDATKTVTYTCPAGYTRSGTKCYRVTGPAYYSCPSGYAKSGSGGSTTCTKITVSQTSATVKKSCPSGYTLSGSTCRKTSTVKASVSSSCPSGYTASGSSCIRYIGGTISSVPPILKTSCPSGYSKSSNGSRCEKPTDETIDAELVQTCEEGWELLESAEAGSKCVLKKTDAGAAV